MTHNLSVTDRVVRGVIGAGIVGWGLTRRNWWAVAAAYPIVTSAIGYDPLYNLFRVNTYNGNVHPDIIESSEDTYEYEEYNRTPSEIPTP